MKKIMFFMVAALAWVVTACSEDEAVINNNENLIKEISLAIEGSHSRVSYTADATGLKFTWANGDVVSVFLFIPLLPGTYDKVGIYADVNDEEEVKLAEKS